MSEKDIDFSAWEAPPPPDGLADAVVARMADPEPLPEPVAPRRRWVIAATAAGVLAIAGGVWAIVRSREPALPDHGEVVADRAQHVELGGVSADLDRGADVRWHRTPHGLEIEQRAGAASWHMRKDEHMTIGATVASIEATGDAAGASLRVEVPMNLSDARVIGASAVTAAAVAMVTVVVYEGHVKVASSGQTVVVQPGTTYTVRQAAPPVVGVATVSDKPRVAVLELGATSREVAVAKELTEDLRARLTIGAYPFVLAPITDKTLVEEAALRGCSIEESACLTAIAGELGADVLLYGHVDKQTAGFEVAMKRYSVSEAEVEREDIEMIPPDQASVDALQDWAKTLGDHLLDDAVLASPKRAPAKKPPAPKPACDADSLIEAGNEALAAGHHGEALDDYEQAIACKPEARTERLAFMAACNAKNVTKAREHWDKLDGPSQNQVVQICIRNGIARDQLDTSCDADDLQSKGMAQEQIGQHAAALAAFEAAMRCKNANPTRLYELSFMVACNTKSLSKAQQYWVKLPSGSAQQLKQMCVRNGITEAMLDGGRAAPPPPGGQGQIRIDSVPQADILLDSKPVGHTPLVLTAAPGKHKVTYVIAGDRFTYSVTVKAGETETLSKDLQ